MELQEFIKNTLIQITNGVIEAQQELKNTGCIINPKGDYARNKMTKSSNDNDTHYRSIQKIKMNVVVNVTENVGSKSGIGVAKIIKAGIDSEESISNGKVTSLEFEIPISFPVMLENK